MAQRCLLLDVGSTSIKWAEFDCSSGTKSPVAALPFPKPVTAEPPLYEVDAEQIFQLVSQAIEGTPLFERLYISTQMHGYLLADKDHHLLTPYISWQDRRSLTAATGVNTAETWFDLFPLQLPPQSGTETKPNSPVCSLFALQQMQPELFARASHFYTLGSYLAYRLTGANATHITDAAATGLFHAATGQPLHSLFPSLHIPLAETNMRPAGQWRQAEVYVPVGDQQASVLGSGLNPGSQYVLNLGTAAQLCVVADGFAAGLFESRPYFDGATLCTVTGLPGGREIAAAGGSLELAAQLTADYTAAMQRLPARSELLVIGGVAKHHRALIEDVCRRIGMAYEIRPEPDALDGLAVLAAERWEKSC